MTNEQIRLTDLKRVTIRVHPEMHEWFTKMANAKGLTMNAIMIFALETYMQQQTMMPMMGDMLRELNKELEKEKQK
jgi:hypothetical protein